MATKIIVSYDGTDNDRDALALGTASAPAGGRLARPRLRPAPAARQAAARRSPSTRPRRCSRAARRGSATPSVPRFVVLSASTPDGLARARRRRSRRRRIVFGSAYRTTPGHVYPQTSAERLLEGGPLAIAIAPAGFADHADERDRLDRRGRRGGRHERRPDGGVARREARRRRSRSGRARTPASSSSARRPGAAQGTVLISAASAYLIELSRCPTIVLPRGVPLAF